MGGGKLVWMFDGVAPVGGPPPILTPDQINGSQLILWLDANFITGLVNADPVATWVDRSSQATNATEAVPTSRPSYRTNVLNTLPVVRFDGVDDLLELSGGGLDGIRNVPGWTISTVVIPRSVTGSQTIIEYASSTPGFNRTFLGLNGAQWRTLVRRVEADSLLDLTAGTAVIGTPAIFSVRANFTTTVVQMWLNGVEIATSTGGVVTAGNTANLSSNAVNIGSYAAGSSQGQLDHGELVVYNRALSDTDRGLVELYYSSKWGVSI